MSGEVTPAALSPVQQAALRDGLPSSDAEHEMTRAALAVLRDDPAGVRQMSRWMAGQHLLGVWCEMLAASMPDHHELRLVHTQHVSQLRTALVCEATAVKALECLGAAGIDGRLIKGLAVAHLDYPDPALRTSGDVDLLVARDHLHSAVAALEAAGFRRSEAAPRRSWEARYARAVMLRSPSGVELDLHVTLAPGYFGARLDHSQLVADVDHIDLGGVRCATLGGPARVVGSAFAAVLSRGAPWRYLRDLAQQVAVSDVDVHRTVEIARAGDAESVLATAVTMAVAAGVIGEHHPMTEWARGVVPSRRAAQALRYAEAGRRTGWLADARSQLMALSFTDGLRFVAGAAVPSKEVRVARGITLGRQLGRGLRFARLRR